MNNNRSIALRRAVMGALALATAPAYAQQAAQRPELAIETLVITAQKREERLQDVPIVVTAVSEERLRDNGVRDLKDLTILTPGLLVTSTTSEAFTTARIRGIGTAGDNPGLESSVGVVIDGVYRPRNGVSFGDLGEVERIEVLKGPQGTLFGKNTSAGVINVVSKKPSFDFGTELELGGGEYGGMEGSLSLTGPIERKVAAGRLYVVARERDGFLDINRGAGPRVEDEDDDRKFYSVRGQLLVLASEAVDVRLAVDYTEHDETCCAAPQLAAAPAIQTQAGLVPIVQTALNATQSGSFANPPNPFQRLAFANRSTRQSIKDRGALLEANWDIHGDAVATSITGFRNWQTVNGQDLDFTTVDILYRDPDGSTSIEFDQLSQELRIAGQTGRLNWLGGVYYANEDLKFRNRTIVGNQFQQYFSRLLNPANPNLIAALTGMSNPFPSGQGARDVFQQDSRTLALFTSNSYQVIDGLTLTLGANYTDLSKDLDTQYFNDNNGAGCQALRNNFASIAGNAALQPALATIYGVGCATITDPLFNSLATSQTLEEQELSSTAKLAYRFNDEVMAYVSYARGYKAGGFNLDRERINGNLSNSPTQGALNAVDPDTTFGRELVDSYELGAKTQWAGDSLLLNGTLFYQDYTNFQLNTFTGLQFVVTALPQVVSQGVDLDMVWYTPLTQLSLQGGVTYAQTTIEDFGTAMAFFRPERKDDTLSFAPELSASLSATFEQPVSTYLVFRSSLGVKYSSEYNTGSNLDPRKIQDALTLVNARIGLGSADRHWDVEFWAQNLTDEDYFQVAFDATLQGSSTGATPTSMIDAFLGAPRTYGATARVRF
jgi:outer membrane receptor protein involved in Fe transport